MRAIALISVPLCGVALILAGGSPRAALGWALLGAGVVQLAVGVFYMRSGMFGRVREHVAPGTIALTYDDGPDGKTTPRLLDLLAEHGAKATFFVIGEHVRAHPEIVKRCVAEGHAIGNHSDRHSYLTNFFLRGRMRREMRACQEAVRAAAGVEPRFYRPPIGLMNPAVVPAARDLGMEVVAWSIRSLDTRRGDPVRRVVPRLRSRAIVLLHDGGLEPERVLETTRRILDAARERDLAAVAIPVD